MDIKNVTFVFNDTETTGTDEEDRIIETAHLAVKNGKLVEHLEELCNPKTVKIKPAAGMTHGYRNSDIKGKPEFKDLESCNTLLEMSEREDCYYVAHNAPFDLGMLGKEGVSWDKKRVIDTLQVAKNVYKDSDEIEMHKLQYFRFFYEEEFEKLEKKYMKKVGVTHIQPHTALSDILVLWIFTEKLMKDFNLSLEDMVELSNKLVIEEKIKFGNKFEHGTPYEEIVNAPYMKFGKQVKGYEYLTFMLEKPEIKEQREKRMSLTLEREYGMYHGIGQCLLKNTIAMTEYNQKCLNKAAAFSFEKPDIIKAMQAQGFKTQEKIIAVFNKLVLGIVKRLEDEIKDYESQEELIDFDKNELEKNIKIVDYIKNFRVNYLTEKDFKGLDIPKK